MAIEILLPRLGWTMEEGVFGEWLVKDGAAVREGDLLFTMEGDKATQEIEALESGILHIPATAPKSGEIVPVGALLGYLLAEGERAPLEETSAPETSAPETSAPETSAPETSAPETNMPETSAPGGQVTRTDGHLASSALNPASPASSPRARRVAAELGIDWRALPGSGRTGRIVERDVRAAMATVPLREASPLQPARTTVIKATPVAQRVAREAGIALSDVAATGTGGRVQRQDVENELARRAEPARSQPMEGSTRQPHSRTRTLIAQRMQQSRQTTASVTLHTEVDATELVALRAQVKTAYGKRNLPAPTYNDLLIKLAAVALREHPALNATWEADALILWDAVHLGLAVDTEAGLLVPVVRDVQHKSVAQIATESRALIARAQAGKATAADLQGGTFTITNLGMYGIDAFTPVINLPECAILGVGRIVEKPVVHEGAIAVRSMITLSLTFDHRAVDGAPAARFLKQVADFVADPALWMLE